MLITVMGDSWASGCWHESDGRTQLYHTGLNQQLTDAGHHVITLARGGSTNDDQWSRLQNHSDRFMTPTEQRDARRYGYASARDADLFVWLWTDTLRGYDWWQLHAPHQHNLYDQQRQQEQWIQSSIDAQTHLKWHQFVMIGGNAPLLTDWPCRSMRSWCEAMGYITEDHATIDPVNWRDFVNWCNGKSTVGNRDYADSPEFTHVFQMWEKFIRSKSHDHKQHHMDYLDLSHERQRRLVYGDDNEQFKQGMMGEDLHPNPEAHQWLTDWILNKPQEQTYIPTL